MTRTICHEPAIIDDGRRQRRGSAARIVDAAFTAVVQGRLWLLNSGAGELLCYDPAQKEARVGAVLPADLRGLCVIGRHVVVGMCQIREKHIFGGLPIQQRFEKLLAGIAVIDLQSGRPVGMFEFTSGCTEIYDVQFLPGVRQPTVLNRRDDATRQAFPAGGT